MAAVIIFFLNVAFAANVTALVSSTGNSKFCRGLVLDALPGRDGSRRAIIDGSIASFVGATTLFPFVVHAEVRTYIIHSLLSS